MKDRNTSSPKGQSYFVYRDDSNKFNLSFKNRNLDVKRQIGDYLARVRIRFTDLNQKKVAKKVGISVRNLMYIETGYGTSMDAIMKVYLYYVYRGVLSVEEQGRFRDLCASIWWCKCVSSLCDENGMHTISEYDIKDYLFRMKKELGILLLEIRLRNQLTQQAVAESINMSGGNLYRIEKKYKTSLDEIVKLYSFYFSRNYRTDEDERLFQRLLMGR